MKTKLSSQQIKNYRQDGCLIVRDFLDDREREGLIEAINIAVATMGKQKIAGSNARDFPEKDGFYDKVFLQRLNLWKISPFIHDMFTSGPLGEMLGKLARYDNTDLDENMSGLFDVYPEFTGIEPVIGEMKAGDAGFHNGLTAHAAGANMTPFPRRAMTCAFMPDGSVYNGQQNILSEQYIAGLNIGNPLQDDKQNPLVGAVR